MVGIAGIQLDLKCYACFGIGLLQVLTDPFGAVRDDQCGGGQGCGFRSRRFIASTIQGIQSIAVGPSLGQTGIGIGSIGIGKGGQEDTVTPDFVLVYCNVVGGLCPIECDGLGAVGGQRGRAGSTGCFGIAYRDFLCFRTVAGVVYCDQGKGGAGSIRGNIVGIGITVMAAFAALDQDVITVQKEGLEVNFRVCPGDSGIPTVGKGCFQGVDDGCGLIDHELEGARQSGTVFHREVIGVLRKLGQHDRERTGFGISGCRVFIVVIDGDGYRCTGSSSAGDRKVGLIGIGGVFIAPGIQIKTDVAKGDGQSRGVVFFMPGEIGQIEVDSGEIVVVEGPVTAVKGALEQITGFGFRHIRKRVFFIILTAVGFDEQGIYRVQLRSRDQTQNKLTVVRDTAGRCTLHQDLCTDNGRACKRLNLLAAPGVHRTFCAGGLLELHIDGLDAVAFTQPQFLIIILTNRLIADTGKGFVFRETDICVAGKIGIQTDILRRREIDDLLMVIRIFDLIVDQAIATDHSTGGCIGICGDRDADNTQVNTVCPDFKGIGAIAQGGSRRQGAGVDTGQSQIRNLFIGVGRSVVQHAGIGTFREVGTIGNGELAFFIMSAAQNNCVGGKDGEAAIAVVGVGAQLQTGGQLKGCVPVIVRIGIKDVAEGQAGFRGLVHNVGQFFFQRVLAHVAHGVCIEGKGQFGITHKNRGLRIIIAGLLNSGGIAKATVIAAVAFCIHCLLTAGDPEGVVVRGIHCLRLGDEEQKLEATGIIVPGAGHSRRGGDNLICRHVVQRDGCGVFTVAQGYLHREITEVKIQSVCMIVLLSEREI